jgi:single-strand DNA-binding protein
MNTITIIGNIGQDPVARFTASGMKVTSFSVATKSRKGNEDITSWFRVSVWGEKFDKMMTYFKKGSYIVVVGELSKPEIYTDKTGKAQIQVEITAHSLHFMPGNKTQEGGAPKASAPIAFGSADIKESEQDEDLPF